jgi:glutathione synthase/RimK-type ligase-like ATP-grasp enzyme
MEVETVFIDQRRVKEYEFEMTIGEAVTGTLSGPEGSFPLEQVRSLYVRPYNFEALDVFTGVERGSAPWRHAAQFEDSMLLWSELANATVVNRPSAMESNGSKPYQLELIRDCGFSVPETLLTTDPDCVLSFLQKHKRVIYKSISSCRSIVSQLTADDVARIEQVSNCPTQFQRFIEGTDVRVHVVGETVVAHRICCTDDDYRYSTQAQIELVTLPADLTQMCVRLSAGLGLAFSGIDLRQSTAGEWYCFEVNPSPGFTYFEKGTGQISLELAKVLAASSTAGSSPDKTVT